MWTDLDMAYRFEHGAGSVEANLRKVAASQINKAIAEIDDPDLEPHKTVHQVRKRCKKLRGLVRLVRDAFDAYKAENESFRDAAARLSYVRDAEVIIQTYDKLFARSSDANQIDPERFVTVRAGLLRRSAEILDQNGLQGRLSQFRDEMQAARKRVEHWTLDELGFKAIAGGLGKTYARARKAMRNAKKEPTAEHFHEWRKGIKYHWYHARLLQDIRPEVMKAHITASDELSELLGDHHDLAVLHDTLSAEATAFGDQAALASFTDLITSRQSELAQQAFALSSSLLAEKRSAFIKRWREYWLSAMPIEKAA
jgi:CHAD domain-containing protein